MNFTFHTTLDTVGNIPRVHYKSIKRGVLFSQGSEVRYLGEVNMLFVYV